MNAWLEGDRRRPLHTVLGLDAAELELVAARPDALRYLLFARRFGFELDLRDLQSQQRIRAFATKLASDHIDPHDLAAIDLWTPAAATVPTGSTQNGGAHA